MNKWYGTLNVNNIEQVANLILDTLSGKQYSSVSSYEYRNFQPEIRHHENLENGTNGTPLSVYYGENNRYAGFNFCDTYGVWGCSTSQQDNRYDPNFNSPYIVIDDLKVEITQRAPNGLLVYWTFSVE